VKLYRRIDLAHWLYLASAGGVLSVLFAHRLAGIEWSWGSATAVSLAPFLLISAAATLAGIGLSLFLWRRVLELRLLLGLTVLALVLIALDLWCAPGLHWLLYLVQPVAACALAARWFASRPGP